MKIIVDRGRCTGIGICESVAEDYFEVADDGSLILHKELVDVRACPAKALTLDET
ncbi:ferredoxin [Rhodococcus erythropolis]|uniref:ferredoxin n=1 Tax=Rhodococcus erythropolis TaxID=1833 RepID=UPI0009950C44|nr:ferredoxin [Rhodococcus erythropolis]MBT1257694.1 ferredoxin [Rhodococcus erythropolis]